MKLTDSERHRRNKKRRFIAESKVISLKARAPENQGMIDRKVNALLSKNQIRQNAFINRANSVYKIKMEIV